MDNPSRHIRCPMLGGMTPTPRPHADSEQQALRLSAEHPMDGLHRDLRNTDVDLLPVRSLPAA